MVGYVMSADLIVGLVGLGFLAIGGLAMWIEEIWCRKLRKGPQWPNISQTRLVAQGFGLLAIFVFQIIMWAISITLIVSAIDHAIRT